MNPNMDNDLMRLKIRNEIEQTYKQIYLYTLGSMFNLNNKNWMR